VEPVWSLPLALFSVWQLTHQPSPPRMMILVAVVLVAVVPAKEWLCPKRFPTAFKVVLLSVMPLAVLSVPVAQHPDMAATFP